MDGRLEGLDIPVTISAGRASLGEMQEYSAGALLALADGRMYAAKEAGRNQVVSSTQPLYGEERLAGVEKKPLAVD